jgi:hypothetical protein
MTRQKIGVGLVVLDPHQHGCHTFMIAEVIGVVGLILARR